MYHTILITPKRMSRNQRGVLFLFTNNGKTLI
nr:MAG TPA: hypothetical protein [Caudoviricetes sp.]